LQAGFLHYAWLFCSLEQTFQPQINMPFFSLSRRSQAFWSLLLILLLSACSGQKAAQKAPTPSQTQFTLLQINDVYEIAPLEGGKVGGMARVASLRKELLAQNPQTYTILAGDFLSPSVIGTVKIDGQRVKGAQMVDVMNATGVDFVCFGNHEFDLKETELQARLDESQFMWIAGNVQQQVGNARFPFQQRKRNIPVSHTLEIPREGMPALKVGIMSLCLPANPQDFVHYIDVMESTRSQWSALSSDTDFVIAITHQTIDQDRALAKAFPGLKLIMGGHEHENHYELVEGVPIAKADANAKSAYVHMLTFDPITGQVAVESILRAIDESVPFDQAVSQKVKSWEEKAYAAFEAQGLNLNEAVTTLTTPLDGLETHIRSQQTNMGEAICKGMYQAYDSLDAAFFNGGSVRIDDYLSGEISQFDIVRTLPFGGKVLKVEIKGALLEKVLETGLQNQGSGGYLQRYKLDKKGEDWQVAGQPLEEDRIYTVAITDFLLLGLEANLEYLTRDNPGVVSVTEPGSEDLGRDVRLALVEYLKNR